MIKVTIPYTGFNLPDQVELIESEIRLIRSGEPNAKSVIMTAHAESLTKGFRDQFPGSYNMAKGTKWGAVVFLVLSVIFFYSAPFPDSTAAGIISLSLGAFCFMMRFLGLGWQLTYDSYKKVVKAHLKLLADAIDKEKQRSQQRR